MNIKWIFPVCIALVFVQTLCAASIKRFFVMIPPDEEWQTAVPMISMDGGITGVPMKVDPERCGWFFYEFSDENISDNVLLYRNDDELREDALGLNGNWETAATSIPIPLESIFELAGDSVFFVPDEDWKTNEDGFYYSAIEVDGIEGNCSYDLAAIIYDTDASLHGAFTCATSHYLDMPNIEAQYNGCPTNAPFSYPANQPTPCVGVTKGIVADLLDPFTKKPTYNAASGCFTSSEAFNAIFQSNTRYNETYCTNIPFVRGADGKWNFDSDNYTSPGATAKGGFYPGESAAVDPSMMLSEAVPAAHNKRKAEGPVFMESSLRKINAVEGVPEIDILCNGPGWNKGVPCVGLFADGGEWSSTKPPKAGISVQGDGWQWSVMGDDWADDVAPEGWTFYKQGTETVVNVANTTNGYGYGNAARWASGGWVKEDKGKAAVQAYDATVFTNGQGRNQHFCFESHAKFIYRKGLRFGVRGDDDIWVFIDNKLAVDIGGMHLPAPGYVDLDYFVGASGGFVVGNEYDLDIFFCDRRTTVSTMSIKTNMYIRQKTGIDVKKRSGANIYDICYTMSGDGSCAVALSGFEGSETYCGDELLAHFTPSYTLVAGNRISSPAVPGVENVTTPGVYKCGVDLTNPDAPKIDKEAVCLDAGRYSLFVTVDGKSKKVATFRVTGSNMDVVYRDGEAKNASGEKIKDGAYKLANFAMGGEFVPVYVSSVGESEKLTDPLEISPEDAVGKWYSLSPSSNLMKIYYRNADGEFERLASETLRTIGNSGVDTLYVTVDMQNLTQAITPFTIGVTGRPNVMTINFYLPKITFIDSIPEDGKMPGIIKGQTSETDGSYREFVVDSLCDLYLAVLKPNEDGSYSICAEECNGFLARKGAETSLKINMDPDEIEFENGYAKISVSSQKEYRYSADSKLDDPAKIVVEINDYVKAMYSPIYFSKLDSAHNKTNIVAVKEFAKNSKFVIMDVQGRVVRQGFAVDSESMLKNLVSGTYVVKNGSMIQLINVR